MTVAPGSSSGERRPGHLRLGQRVVGGSGARPWNCTVGRVVGVSATESECSPGLSGRSAKPDNSGCRTCGHPEHRRILRPGVRGDLGVRFGATRGGPLDRADRSSRSVKTKGPNAGGNTSGKCFRLSSCLSALQSFGWRMPLGVHGKAGSTPVPGSLSKVDWGALVNDCRQRGACGECRRNYMALWAPVRLRAAAKNRSGLTGGQR